MDNLKALLRLDEGLRLRAYRCTAGRQTIGVGRNLDDNPLSAEEVAHLGRENIRETGITEEEAYYLLDSDIRSVTARLRHALPWFSRLGEVRQAALVDLGFMGVAKLLKFSQTLPAIRDGRYTAAADFLSHTKWAADVGPNRTRRICGMIRTGEWPADLKG